MNGVKTTTFAYLDYRSFLSWARAYANSFPPEKMENQRCNGKYTKSPDFCFNDGTIWIRVERTLYCLHRGILESHSETFAQILPMRGTGGDKEDNPVFLESITSADFDYLVRHIFIGWVAPPPYDTAMLISLLKLGSLYQMKLVLTFAQYHIKDEPRISPATKINLARRYTIPDWVRPAFEALVRTGPLHITDEDIDQLGLVTYAILTRAQAEIARERLRLSLAAPPTVLGDGCVAHDRCEGAWKEFWGIKVSRWLNHPDKPPRLSKTCEFIEQLGDIPFMRSRCHSETLLKLRGMAPLRAEERITEEGVEKVLAFHRLLEL
ncbi:hypothetical protein BC835DRAFT_1307499 [Cytidiella melzeri]|nr:hypothetical protein BC835DRAFT_1307499 [Cytidiella melzeri]